MRTTVLGTGLTTAVVPVCRLLSGNTLAVGMFRTTLVVAVGDSPLVWLLKAAEVGWLESFFLREIIFFSVTTMGVSFGAVCGLVVDDCCFEESSCLLSCNFENVYVLEKR